MSFQTYTRPRRAAVSPAAVGPVTRAIRGLRPNEMPSWEIREAEMRRQEAADLLALRRRIAAQAVPLVPGVAGMGTDVAVPKTAAYDPTLFADEYAMRVAGTCLEPTFMDGCALLFSKTETFRLDDFVVIHLKPEFVREGSPQATVKQVVLCVRPPAPGTDPSRISNIAPCLVVQQLNPKRSYTIPWDCILAVHKCMGLVPENVRLVPAQPPRKARKSRAKVAA